MNHPLRVPGARICIIRHPDETTICANIAGFRALGEWIAWLVASDPSEHYHFHLLWHLESEASRFEGKLPKNVWVLAQPGQPTVPVGETPAFEFTFQVVTDPELDELAEHQASGTVPARFQKHEASLATERS